LLIKDEDASLKGVQFYQNYGQHDDRPLLRRPTPTEDNIFKEELKKVEPKEAQRVVRRPGEIRFGGMSFALPPPGRFPDRPAEQDRPRQADRPRQDDRPVSSVKHPDDRPISSVYPNLAASSGFKNRPVSDVFRDLPGQIVTPNFPIKFPGSGISLEDSQPDIQIPSFENFFKDKFNKEDDDDRKYLGNPFGDSFIKMEIDPTKFKTNKTRPSVHHIPLDIHGFPKVPNFEPEHDAAHQPTDRPKRKLYRPPPVLTKYDPPQFRSVADDEESDITGAYHDIEYVPQQPRPATAAKSGFPFSVMKEAMTTLPSALQNLPFFMEKLLGNQASWAQRMWQGERDEAASAARAFDSIPAFDFDSKTFNFDQEELDSEAFNFDQDELNSEAFNFDQDELNSEAFNFDQDELNSEAFNFDHDELDSEAFNFDKEEFEEKDTLEVSKEGE